MNRSLRDFKFRRSLFEKFRIGLWMLVNRIFVRNALIPAIMRKSILSLFGAKIGARVILRSSVMIHFPWNITIGSDCWIGEQVWFINHEKIFIGSNVCISQRSVICSSGHNYRSPSLEYAHSPVVIKDGAWVCFDAKVLPGVTIGECAVVSAGEIARNSLPDYSMLVSGQVRQIDRPN